MPAPKCNGGKDSRRWVGTRNKPKRQNRLERWRDGRRDGAWDGRGKASGKALGTVEGNQAKSAWNSREKRA